MGIGSPRDRVADTASYAHHRAGRVERASIDVQHVFHPRDESRACCSPGSSSTVSRYAVLRELAHQQVQGQDRRSGRHASSRRRLHRSYPRAGGCTPAGSRALQPHRSPSALTGGVRRCFTMVSQASPPRSAYAETLTTVSTFTPARSATTTRCVDRPFPCPERSHRVLSRILARRNRRRMRTSANDFVSTARRCSTPRMRSLGFGHNDLVSNGSHATRSPQNPTKYREH